jgi:hypothetical protein
MSPPPELVWPSLILAIIGIVVSIPVWVFVQHGFVLILSHWSQASHRDELG